MKKKIVLFGSGVLGYEALIQIGEEMVEYFCDNNKSIVGTEKYGKKVISSLQLGERASEFVVVVCAAIDKAYIIAKQLEQLEINNYWIYEMVKKEEKTEVKLKSAKENEKFMKW